jgi:hypothetical protein
MNAAHIASTLFFVGVLSLSVAAIVRTLRGNNR